MVTQGYDHQVQTTKSQPEACISMRQCGWVHALLHYHLPQVGQNLQQEPMSSLLEVLCLWGGCVLAMSSLLEVLWGGCHLTMSSLLKVLWGGCDLYVVVTEGVSSLQLG